jgi:hypothetical protein
MGRKLIRILGKTLLVVVGFVVACCLAFIFLINVTVIYALLSNH